MAGIGASLSGLAAAIGLLVASPWFRRSGGLLIVAALAVLASTLPYMLFKWTTVRDTWASAYLMHDSGNFC